LQVYSNNLLIKRYQMMKDVDKIDSIVVSSYPSQAFSILNLNVFD